MLGRGWFPHLDRGTIASINFVTAHDGFTLADLTTYERKRNEANGQGGLDGTDDNRSWNHGIEGPTDDPSVNARRRRSMRNLMGTLLLSTHGYWMFHPDPTDYWRWTRDGLVRQVEDAGFGVQSVKGVMNLAASGLQLFQDGVSAALPRLLQPPFFFCMNRAMAIVDRLGSDASRDRDASVYIVLAQKHGASA